MQPTNGHIMDPSFVNDPCSETGGSRCKTRCPSAAVVKPGSVAIQRWTMRDEDRRWSGLCSNPRRANNGVKSGKGAMWCTDLPRLPQLCLVPGGRVNEEHEKPHLWKPSQCEEVDAFQQWGSYLKHPPTSRLSPAHTTLPPDPLFRHTVSEPAMAICLHGINRWSALPVRWK